VNRHNNLSRERRSPFVKWHRLEAAIRVNRNPLKCTVYLPLERLDPTFKRPANCNLLNWDRFSLFRYHRIDRMTIVGDPQTINVFEEFVQMLPHPNRVLPKRQDLDEVVVR
jgi:hypothetical protein